MAEITAKTTPPTPKAPPPVVTMPTSGDKYIVRTPIGDRGEFRQEVLTKEEIEARGGTVPEQAERASVLHQTGVEEGYKARQAKETEFRQQDAAKALAEAENMSYEAALATIQRFEKNPTATEFVQSAPEAIATLAGVSRVSSTGMERLSRARAEQFKAENIPVGIQQTGKQPQYISKVDYAALEKTDPAGAEVLRRQGFEAYQGRVRDIQRTYDEQVAEQTRQRTLSINDWLQNQIDTGQAKNKAEAERQLAEVQSGRYKVFMPSDTDPEDVSKGGMVDVWAGFIEQREQAGLTPQELGEIYSGKYKVPDTRTGQMAPTIKEYYDSWVAQGSPTAAQVLMRGDIARETPKILAELREKGFATEVGKLAPGEYGPEVPEEMRWNYDLLGALDAGFDRSKLLAVFGGEAVDRAVATQKAIIKLEKAGGSPLWAWGTNQITKDELRLIFGDNAEQLASISEWEKAQRTKEQTGLFDMDNVLASTVNARYILGAGAEWSAVKVAGLRDKAKYLVSSIPVGGTAGTIAKGVATVPLRVGVGVLMAGAGLVGLMSFMAGIPTNVSNVEYYKDFGRKTGRAFIDMGKEAIRDPVGGGSEIVGMFLGPKGVVKLANVLRAKASPWYVPNTAARFTFSTGKLATKSGDIGAAIKADKLTEVQVANAITRVMNRAMQNPSAKATARLGNTNIRVHIEPTPASSWMGNALWRATPSRQPYKGLERVVDVKGKEPAEFYSLQAAPRFALSSAGGTKATSPALVMVYTKAGQLRAYPTSIQYASNLAKMQQAGFGYLGSGRAKPGAYGPIKTYASRFEQEAMLPNGMKTYRVQNFRSRILGAGAGEFVTTVDGWVMPIYRFAEKGATIPKVGLSELAAMRVASIGHGVKIMLGKRGFGSEAGYASVRTLTSQLESLGRAAMASLKGATARAAYEKAIDQAMVNRINDVYRDNQSMLERAWREKPEQFERAYLENLARLQARASDYRLDPRSLRTDYGYTTIRVAYDRDGLIERAREFDRELTRVATGREPVREDIADRGMRELRTNRMLRDVTTPRRADRLDRVDRVLRPPELARITRIDRPLRTDRPTRPDRPERPERPDRPDIPRIPRIPRIDEPPPPPTTIITTGADVVGKKARLPEGSISWRQGIFWKWIPREDYTTGAAKPRTLPKGVTPIGAKFTDLRKPTETIQMIGDPGASVPDVAVDLGVADIFISDQAQTIRYTGKGEQTNVGIGVDSTTMGMTVEGGTEPKGHAYAKKVYPRHSVSRTADAKEMPERSTRELRGGKDRVEISKRTNEMLEREYKEPVVTELAEVAPKTQEPRDGYPDLLATGYGKEAYFDEDPEWLESLDPSILRTKKKSVNRIKLARQKPKRGSGPATTVGGIRL